MISIIQGLYNCWLKQFQLKIILSKINPKRATRLHEKNDITE